jgi:hypothetical protein
MWDLALEGERRRIKLVFSEDQIRGSIWSGQLRGEIQIQLQLGF